MSAFIKGKILGNTSARPTDVQSGTLYVNTDEKELQIFKNGVWESTKFTPIVVILKDHKPSGSNGGTMNSGAYRTRDLNVISDSTKGVTLSTNQFTITDGTWHIHASAPTFGVLQNSARLYDITNSTVISQGTSEYIGTGTAGFSIIDDTFTVYTPTVFAIQHMSINTRAANGLGVACGASITMENEVYTIVRLTRLS